MATRGLLVALLLLTVSPQTPPLFPVHVESPLYPSLARMARIQGDIVVSALVGTDGHVIGVPNAPSGHPLLAKAAEENIKTWRFQSGVEGEVKITYHFKMQGKPTYGYPETICEFDFPDSITIITNVPAPNP
jgi:TonB family protein